MKNLLQAHLRSLLALALGSISLGAQAQLVINDTLTKGSSSYDWKPLNGACLTAGDGTGSIPACTGLAYYSGKTLVGGTGGRLPDVSGSGALRLTNGDTTTGSNGNNQTGSVVSNFTFPSTEGIAVTWTSVSYGGNNYSGTGADGITFFLSDGAYSPTIGAFGGSLGYSCANAKNPSDGVEGGYIGIGIDEYGNFANPGDNTDTGPGFKAGRISIRGAGFTNWDYLSKSAAYGKYYPGTTVNDTAIQKTCASGYAYNYSGIDQFDSLGNTIHNGGKTGDKLPFNYKWFQSSDVNGVAKLADGTSVTLANQEAISQPKRGNANIFIFSLKITADGIMDFSYSVVGAGSTTPGATVAPITGVKINNAAFSGPLPATFRFGFSSGTGGGSNVHEITCFKAEPVDVSNSSAGSNVQQGQLVPGGAQVFLALYHPVNWWGQLTANLLALEGNKLVAVGAGSSGTGDHAQWDASCVLTGGACTAISPDTKNPLPVTAQAVSTRKVITWNNATDNTAKGIPFKTFTSLPSSEQTSLGSQKEVDYLRGDRSNEALNNPPATAGVMRNRTSVLGDIVDSSPLWVGPPAFDYANAWQDKLTGIAQPEGTSYAAFQSGTAATRTNVVYVGSNDGLMHGFSAGTISADGTTLSNNTGTEVLAYIPGQVVSAIRPVAADSTIAAQVAAAAALDYSNTAYQHNFQVDATPGMGDLYYSGKWHTWLVSGIGAGGHKTGPVNSNTATIPAPVSALFALDITDPSTFNDSDAAAQSTVVGEWTSDTIACATNLTCGTNFGQTVGTPLIRRLHDGKWAIIFGNGLNSSSGRAGIFIIHLSSAGVVSDTQYIDAGQGPGNGIVSVSSADLDGDHITDFIYAGDALGNLWRFDLHSKITTDWSTAVTKVFTALGNQPITTAPLVSAIPASNASGYPKLLVSFGTGQKLPITSTSGEVFASGVQALYGVWDANMSTWNGTNTDTKYDSLSTTGQPILAAGSGGNPAPLTVQSVTQVAGKDGLSYRSVSTNPVCWSGSSACGTGNTMLGWALSLPSTGEQTIFDPVQIEDSFVVNTVIPKTEQPLTCDVVQASGFTMAIDVSNGSGDLAPLTDGTNFYSGVGGIAAGTAAEYTYNGNTYVGSGTNNGKWSSNQWIRHGGTVTPVTWTKLR
jgi:type IV pilus assembly protein PilY1